MVNKLTTVNTFVFHIFHRKIMHLAIKTRKKTEKLENVGGMQKTAPDA